MTLQLKNLVQGWITFFTCSSSNLLESVSCCCCCPEESLYTAIPEPQPEGAAAAGGRGDKFKNTRQMLLQQI